MFGLETNGEPRFALAPCCFQLLQDAVISSRNACRTYVEDNQNEFQGLVRTGLNFPTRYGTRGTHQALPIKLFGPQPVLVTCVSSTSFVNLTSFAWAPSNDDGLHSAMMMSHDSGRKP